MAPYLVTPITVNPPKDRIIQLFIALPLHSVTPSCNSIFGSMFIHRYIFFYEPLVRRWVIKGMTFHKKHFSELDLHCACGFLCGNGFIEETQKWIRWSNVSFIFWCIYLLLMQFLNFIYFLLKKMFYSNS